MNRTRTLYSQASSSRRDSGESVLDLDELPARREDSEGVTRKQVCTSCQASGNKRAQKTHLYAPPSAVAMWIGVGARDGTGEWWGKQRGMANRAVDA